MDEYTTLHVVLLTYVTCLVPQLDFDVVITRLFVLGEVKRT